MKPRPYDTFTHTFEIERTDATYTIDACIRATYWPGCRQTLESPEELAYYDCELDHLVEATATTDDADVILDTTLGRAPQGRPPLPDSVREELERRIGEYVPDEYDICPPDPDDADWRRDR